MKDGKKERTEILLTEYAAAQEDYLHNDAFAWDIGSILIAGAFVFWALLADKELSLEIFSVGMTIVCLLMSTWVLYSHLYRQIWLFKLSRMWEIENELGMQLHIGWDKKICNDKPRYPRHGPRGFHMIIFIYVLVTLTGPVIGWINYGARWPLLLPIIIVASVCCLIARNENKTQESLKKIKADIIKKMPIEK